MREINVHVDGTRDPARNLVREEKIFDLVDRGEIPETVRLWTNTECLVRGRVKHPKYGWYREDLARRLNVPVFERSTGGGVVYHDIGNLNWSFFLRTDGSFLSPTAAFGRASRFILVSLSRLGIRASFAPPNRIDVASRKVSGMAARSTVHTLLVHGTLLLNSDLEKLNMLCIPPRDSPPVANLSEWVPGIDADDVAEVLPRVLGGEGFDVRIADALG